MRACKIAAWSSSIDTLMRDDEEMLVVDLLAVLGAEEPLRRQDLVQMQILAVEHSLHQRVLVLLLSSMKIYFRCHSASKPDYDYAIAYTRNRFDNLIEIKCKFTLDPRRDLDERDQLSIVISSLVSVNWIIENTDCNACISAAWNAWRNEITTDPFPPDLCVNQEELLTRCYLTMDKPYSWWCATNVARWRRKKSTKQRLWDIHETCFSFSF